MDKEISSPIKKSRGMLNSEIFKKVENNYE
jgi:hypothetical protein